jgi:hypothetical protein
MSPDFRQLLERLAGIEARISAFSTEAEQLRTELDKAGPLSRLAETPKIRLPRPTLARHPGNIRLLWQEYRGTSKKVAELKRRIRAQASAERQASLLKEKERLELISLEQDTRTLVALSELFSLWRKFHVPLSWLMWWIVGLHLFGWIYY